VEQLNTFFFFISFLLYNFEFFLFVVFWIFNYNHIVWKIISKESWNFHSLIQLKYINSLPLNNSKFHFFTNDYDDEENKRRKKIEFTVTRLAVKFFFEISLGCDFNHRLYAKFIITSSHPHHHHSTIKILLHFPFHQYLKRKKCVYREASKWIHQRMEDDPMNIKCLILDICIK
jgi:hypothetical protein